MPGAALAALTGALVRLSICRVNLVCGPYEAGEPEGYIAEYVERPTSFYFKVGRIDVDITGFEGSSIFNPFSWRTLSPQLAFSEVGTAGCVRTTESVALPPGIEAGEARAVQSCLDYRKGITSGEPALGSFKLLLEEPVTAVRVGAQNILKTREVEGSLSQGALSLISRGTASITIKTGSLNHAVRLLYINKFGPAKEDSHIDIQGNVFHVRTPIGGLAVASLNPVEARIKPGSVQLTFTENLKLALGGELEAFRLLAELSYSWSPLEVDPGKKVPGYWSVSSAAVILKLTPREIAVKAVNPLDKPGVVSIQPPFRPRAAWLETPLGSEELVASHDVRIPAPPCFCGVLRLKGSVFERLSRGGPRLKRRIMDE